MDTRHARSLGAGLWSELALCRAAGPARPDQAAFAYLERLTPRVRTAVPPQGKHAGGSPRQLVDGTGIGPGGTMLDCGNLREALGDVTGLVVSQCLGTPMADMWPRFVCARPADGVLWKAAGFQMMAPLQSQAVRGGRTRRTLRAQARANRVGGGSVWSESFSIRRPLPEDEDDARKGQQIQKERNR